MGANENEQLKGLYPSTPCSASWIRITDEIPNTGIKVIVCGHYSTGQQWRAMARWQPARTIDATYWDPYPEDWEDDDGNTITNPYDVWLEESVELEATGFLENVTHWMPLPSLPTCSLS